MDCNNNLCTYDANRKAKIVTIVGNVQSIFGNNQNFYLAFTNFRLYKLIYQENGFDLVDTGVKICSSQSTADAVPASYHFLVDGIESPAIGYSEYRWLGHQYMRYKSPLLDSQAVQDFVAKVDNRNFTLLLNHPLLASDVLQMEQLFYDDYLKRLFELQTYMGEECFNLLRFLKPSKLDSGKLREKIAEDTRLRELKDDPFGLKKLKEIQQMRNEDEQ